MQTRVSDSIFLLLLVDKWMFSDAGSLHRLDMRPRPQRRGPSLAVRKTEANRHDRSFLPRVNRSPRKLMRHVTPSIRFALWNE
eukprot:151218-Hanusia_phi.AAC.1